MPLGVEARRTYRTAMIREDQDGWVVNGARIPADGKDDITRGDDSTCHNWMVDGELMGARFDGAIDTIPCAVHVPAVLFFVAHRGQARVIGPQLLRSEHADRAPSASPRSNRLNTTALARRPDHSPIIARNVQDQVVPYSSCRAQVQ